jgi:uncharacterized protein YecA (UPF0149 family)
MPQSVTSIEQLVANALDDRRVDNGQTRAEWCEKFGLDGTDVSNTAVVYFAEQRRMALALGLDEDWAVRLAVADTFLYGLLLGRHLP